MGSGDSWHLATHRSTTLSCSHARRCARRARELSDTQAEWFQGQSANPLAAALLLQLLRLLHVLHVLHVYACDQQWTSFHTHTHTLGRIQVLWISADLACSVTHRTS